MQTFFLLIEAFVFSQDTIYPPFQGLHYFSDGPAVINSVQIDPFVPTAEIDPVNGTIFFPDTFMETLTIKYVPVFEFSQRVYAVFSPVQIQDTTNVLDLEAVNALEENEEIEIGGEKTFGFSWNGAGKGEIRQDLAVNFTGEVDDYWSIGGQISSRGDEGPVPLGDLDKILLSLESPVFCASLGDIEEQRYLGLAGELSDDILGARAEINSSNFSAGASYGEVKEESRVVTIEVQFGFQGPYAILESSDNRNLVPGSERVYLNGLPLGSEDYRIVNLNGAFITFSSDVELEDEDRVVVFYKASGNAFRRFSHSVSLKALLGDFFVKYDRAGLFDVKEAPFGFSLSDRTIGILENLGDSIDKAWIDAGVFVGQRRGSYELEGGVYVYKGYEKGSYEVSFLKVDTTEGDYVYDDALPGYRYVGENSGDYTPKIRVSPAKSKSVEALSAGFGNRNIEFSVTGAMSEYDKNLFSGDDDEDNQGYASGVNLSLSGDNFSFGSEIVSLEDRFSPIDDYGHKSPIEYFSSFLCPGGFWGKSELSLSLKNVIVFRGDAGVLKNRDFDKSRIYLSLILGNSSKYISLGRIEQRIDSTTELYEHSRNMVNTSLTGGCAYSIFRPELTLSRENAEDSMKFVTDRARAKIAFLLSERFVFSVFALFDDKIICTADRKEGYSLGREEGVQGSYRSSSIVSEFYASKKREFPGRLNPSPQSSFYLGKAVFQMTSSGRVFLKTEYSLSRTRHYIRRAIFEEVEENEGNYSYDSSGHFYYPDPRGRYIRRWERTGASLPVTDVSFVLDFSPEIGNTLFLFSLKAVEQNSSENSFAVAVFHPEETMKQDFTVKGSRILRAGFRRYIREISEIWGYLEIENYFSSPEEEDISRSKGGLSAGYEFDSNFRFREDLSFYRHASRKLSLDETASYEEFTTKTLAGAEFGRLEPRLVFELEARKYRGYLNYPGIGEFNLYKTDLSGGLSLSGALRSDFSLGLTYNFYSTKTIPAQLRATDCQGYVLHWDLTSNAYLSANLQFFFSYGGEKRFEESTYQKLSTGIKVLF
ncbi:hypothetical protein JXA84_01685 [candidate division WOR-3 bacterium]|nr:hypothetical protein [candidate division WOR-3 bacterium]